MADNSKYAQLQAFTLAGSGCVLGATTITLNSMLQIDGSTTVTMTNFGSKGFATLEPGNGTREEQIVFTGITQNANGTATLTGVSNVLFVSPYTETSGVAQSHPGGVTLVISNTSGFYDTFVNKNDDETIAGLFTFPDNDTSAARIASDVDTAVATAFVTLGQLSRQAISGASNASTTVKGIVQLPTQAQVDARTTTGSTSALLALTPDKQRSTLLSDYIVDTGSANAYAIAPTPAVTAYVTGQVFSFKSTNTNTLTSTLAVSGLATKTIQRGGAILGAGDIISGQIYVVEYDGTNFQLLTPVNTTPAGVIQMYVGATAPTGWLLCDGTSYLNATYPSLFAVISTTYGSADGTHFNVPDMRGRVPVGVGTGTGGGAAGTGLPTGGSALTAVVRAGWKGEETHTLTTTEIPSHTHSIPNNQAAGSGSTFMAQSNGGGNAQTINTGSAGSDGAHNNIQPILGVSFIIKT